MHSSAKPDDTFPKWIAARAGQGTESNSNCPLSCRASQRQSHFLWLALAHRHIHSRPQSENRTPPHLHDAERHDPRSPKATNCLSQRNARSRHTLPEVRVGAGPQTLSLVFASISGGLVGGGRNPICLRLHEGLKDSHGFGLDSEGGPKRIHTVCRGHVSKYINQYAHEKIYIHTYIHSYIHIYIYTDSLINASVRGSKEQVMGSERRGYA